LKVIPDSINGSTVCILNTAYNVEVDYSGPTDPRHMEGIISTLVFDLEDFCMMLSATC